MQGGQGKGRYTDAMYRDKGSGIFAIIAEANLREVEPDDARRWAEQSAPEPNQSLPFLMWEVGSTLHTDEAAVYRRDSRNRRIACRPIGPAPPNMRQLQVCHRNPVGIWANCRDGHLDGTG